MSDELLPCPFCGSGALVCEGGINGKMQVYGLVEHKNGCFFLADGLPTKYQHITNSDFDAWNTRAERTCRIEGRYGNQYCTCCGEMIGTWDSESELYISSNMVELWNYCPNCGTKVVDA